VRIAAVGDVHVGLDTRGHLAPCLGEVSHCADVLLLAGDLTRVGDPAEAEVLAEELEVVDIPVAAVLGNHDHHTDRAQDVAAVLARRGVCMLEGDSVIFDVRGESLGVAGVMGFGGGFAGRSASEFGEPEMKAFVRRTVAAAHALHGALCELDTDLRVALLHYSPVPDTLGREPLEIYPFLGSYLLSEAVDRAGADLVLHGHAHRGSERGLTPGGVKVRNVAQPVLGAPFRVFELEVGPRQLRVGPTGAEEVGVNGRHRG
jgi:Icc-related predicted phosphoesterase